MRIVLEELTRLGIYAGPIDKYVERQGPFDYEIVSLYRKTKSALEELGKAVVPEEVVLLPYITEGIISAPKVDELFTIERCLVGNSFFPILFSGRVAHRIRMAGVGKDVRNAERFIARELYSRELDDYSRVVQTYNLERIPDDFEVFKDLKPLRTRRREEQHVARDI